MEQVNEIIQDATISAVVVRADGTVEDLGVIDSYDANELVECAMCRAQMQRRELHEHELACATIALAQEVNKITDR